MLYMDASAGKIVSIFMHWSNMNIQQDEI